MHLLFKVLSMNVENNSKMIFIIEKKMHGTVASRKIRNCCCEAYLELTLPVSIV